MRRIEMIGHRFGRLVVKEQSAEKIGDQLRYVCECDCGTICLKRGIQLRTGRCKSCGCIVRRHGHSAGGKKSRIYMVWDSMISRCNNPAHPAYLDYGGRGISVCKHWADFANFLADMGEPPVGMTLERKKNGLGYSKANCEWASRSAQNRNKRDNRILTVDGVSMCIQDWAERLGWARSTIDGRLQLGWSETEALSVPPGLAVRGERQRDAKLSDDKVRFIRGSNLSGVELARKFGVSKSVISCVRLGRTWRHVA